MKFSEQQKLSTNTTGHLHVSYHSATKDYVVAISRKDDSFYLHVTTLDEAVKIRNQVYSFYERRGRFPSRAELGIQRRQSRSKGRKIRTEDTICSMCGSEYRFKSLRRYEEFIQSGKICGYCQRKQSRDISISTENATGVLQEKYITFDKSYATGTRYRVCVTKDRQYFAKTYDTLEEAIKIRDEVVNFHKENGRLPNAQEQDEIFGIKSKPRERKNELNERSNVSNTNLRNITFDKTCNRYFVQISRNRQKFSTSSKTLEDSIAVRNAVIKFYTERGHLPTSTEFKSFRKELRNA